MSEQQGRIGPSDPSSANLRRTLGLWDAVLIGLGSMIGAGVFVALAPAAAAAGTGLLVGLVIAGVVAYGNAASSARLAARYPVSGGTYVYGRERLGPFWGHLAGWSFVIGKIASCAAMALTVGVYLWPEHARVVAVLTVAVLTAVNYAGIQKSARLTRIIVGAVLVVLMLVVAMGLGSSAADGTRIVPTVETGHLGIFQAAGLLFFAFAGYARIATLGEEVREPRRTIPRAIAIALGITIVVYALVACVVLAVLGADAAAHSPAPLAEVARRTGIGWLEPVVQGGAALAAIGALLALVLGVSRTVLAMARDGHLPTALSAIHPRHDVPHRAEVVVGLVVAVLAATIDLRAAIGFSSFGVLVYYAIANASAWTLDGRIAGRFVAGLGLLGCLVLAATLPLTSVLAGGGVVLVGAAVYAVRGRLLR